jgi:hypothetical protein
MRAFSTPPFVTFAHRKHRFVIHGSWSLAPFRLAAAGWIALATAAAGQTPQQTIVPAFFFGGINQLTDPPTYDWTRIEQAGSAVFAVVAEGSFPFLADDCPLDSNNNPIVPTDCHASGVIGLCQAKCQFARNRAAGQKVFGYVMTGSGTRDYDYTNDQNVLVHNCPSAANHKCVLTGGDTVLPTAGGYKDSPQKHLPWVQKWYDVFCPSQSNCFIDGIFFDVGPSMSSKIPDATQQADYQDLFADFKNERSFGPCSDATHPARPCLLINASQYTNSWAASIADYVIVWELALHGKDNQPANNQDYVTNFQPTPLPTWWSNNATRAQHVVTVATQNDVAAIVQSSRDASHGFPSFLYIHDQFTYGRLSCFFEKEVRAMQNQSAVPGKTWCDATQSCLDINVTPCSTDELRVIIVTNPATGVKIPVVLSF